MSNRSIYDAYLYKFHNFVVIISYTPGSYIKNIIKDINEPFQFNIVKLKVKNKEYQYDILNDKIEKLMAQNETYYNTNKPELIRGILIYGHTFPINKIKFNIDFHIHISLSQEVYLSINPDKTFEQYTKYKTITKDNYINKYFNVKKEITIELNDDIYNIIIDFIEFKVYEKQYEKFTSKHNYFLKRKKT